MQRQPKAVNQMSHISLQNISHQYGKKIILDDISFDIERGEIICLLGASGSGKSTLLRLIAGVETLNSGSITINGQTIVDEQVFMPPEQRQIGMVFQDYALFPHLTVVQNIMFGLKSPQHSQRKITHAEAMQQLNYIGLVEYADNYPNILSGGQQQRVALARTLATKPEILLLDEPFSGLDSHLREELRTDTKKLINDNEISAIFVTHDAEEALFLADRIILLNQNKIEQMGTTDELLNHPISPFAAHYLRRYNEINVKIDGEVITTPFGQLKTNLFQTQLTSKHANAKLLVAQNDIHLESYDDPDEYDHQIEVEVTAIHSYSEFSELHLRVLNSEQQLVLRTSLREKQVKIGDKFKAHFNYKNLFIFADNS